MNGETFTSINIDIHVIFQAIQDSDSSGGMPIESPETASM